MHESVYLGCGHRDSTPDKQAVAKNKYSKMRLTMKWRPQHQRVETTRLVETRNSKIMVKPNTRQQEIVCAKEKDNYGKAR